MKRKFMILFLLVIAMVASVFGVTACGSSKGITLGSTEVSIEVGGIATISAKSSSGNSISWTSSDTSVATVSSLANAAIVKGVSEGESTLTATDGEYSATCKVTVTAATTYTILLNGSAVTSADVIIGESVTFTATASDGSTVSYWHVADTSTATVSDDGVVTGVSFGTTTLYAGKDSSNCNSITLNVVAAEGSEGYTLELSTEDTALAADSDVWRYWTEYCGMYTYYYLDGAITLTFDNNAGNWYNLQLFYKNSTLSEGSNYKLTCKINTTVAGTITVNGSVVELAEGDNNVSVTYTEGSGSSVSIQFGENGASPVTDIIEGTVVLSDFSWSEIQAETLAAPSFTVSSSGVITITDTNDAEKVSGYKLYLYNASGVLAGAVDVINGMNISDLNTSAIAIGTYTAYLRAIGSSTVYTNSENSTSYTTITVTEEPKYTLSYAEESDAVSTPGVWYYWASTWVTIKNNAYADDIVTISFSNNDGFWYDTQLFYKATNLTEGQIYTLTFTLNSTAAGKITVNGTVIELQEGDNAIEVSYIESSGASVSIQFGVESSGTDLKAADVTISNVKWTEAEQETLATPSFTVANNVITITDTNDSSKVGSYRLYLYSGNTLAGSVTVTNGMDLSNLDTSTIAKGTYTAYLRAIGSSILYIDSANSATSTTITVTEDPSYELSLKGETDAMASSYNTWYYWTEWGEITTKTYANETLTLEFSNNTINFYNIQLFYKNGSLTQGTTYTLTMNINSSVAGSITVNGTVVNLIAGDNAVTVSYTEGSSVSISIQLGVDGGSNIEAGTIIISNVEWTAGGSSSGDNTTISYAEQTVAVANPGSWYYWRDEWVTVSNNTYADGVATITVSNNAGNWYSTQLFYKNSSLTAGTSYTLTMTINSTVAGNITVNGEVIALVVGNNSVSVTYTESSDSASISIQLGVDDGNNTTLGDGTITISNVNWTSNGGSSSGSGTSGGSSATEPDTSNAVTVSLAFVESYNDYYFYLTATSTYDLTTASYVTVNGTKALYFENPSTITNTYAFKVYVGDLTLSSYVFYWYDSTGTVVAMGTYSTTSSGDSGSSGGSSSGDSGSTDSGVTLNATYVNFYGATWLEVQVVTELDLTTTSGLYTVKYNGSTAIASNIYYYGDSSNNTINIQVQISTETITTIPSSNVITFYDANGNLVATVNYTP